MVKYDAVIVGGGVIGSAIAYYMAGQGARPLVLEKDRLASQSSGAAAGMLAAQAELDVSDPLYEMARQSRDMFPALAEQLREYSGLDIGLVNRGMLKVALTPEQERKFRRMTQVQRETGEPVTWLSAREAREREPGLSDAVLGAIDIPADGHVSAPELSRAFALSAAALGADIREYAEVVELEAEHGQISGRADRHGANCLRQAGS